MPIKFRCKHCRQFLGISQSKAGAIVDCPTCGRSIRVPQLDGRVDPLPEPELNLDDSELVQALDALAAIVEHPESQAANVGPVIPDPEGDEIPQSPAPQPEPIVVSPPLPAEPVSGPEISGNLPAVSGPTESESGSDSKSDESSSVKNGSKQTSHTTDVNDSDDPLAALASVDRPEQAHGTKSKSFSRVRGNRASRNMLNTTLVLVVFLFLFIFGYLVGRQGYNRQLDQASGDRNDSQSRTGRNGAHSQATLGPWAIAIRGRITYKSVSGESRPDHGACVIVFPETKQGEVKLSCVGFRPGDSETDFQVAAAAIKTLGGNIAVVDEHGNFEVELPKAGKYRILVLSRFQKRDESIEEPPGLRRLLQQFFDRAPDQLLGTVQYEFTELFYNGERVNVWDHSFIAE